MTLSEAEIREAQEALRQSEERYRALVEGSLQGIVVMQDNRIVFTNRAFADISGYSVEELKALEPGQVVAMVHPDDREKVWGSLRKRMAGEPVEDGYEFQGVRKDGSLRPLEIRASLIEYNGRPAVQGTFLDISQRKCAQEELRRSEARFRELAEMLPETVFEMDTEGRLTFVNRKAFEYFQYSPEEFEAGLTAFDMLAPEDHPRARSNAARVLAGEEIGLTEYTAIRKDGSTFPIMLHSSPVVREGAIVGLRGFIIDLSEKKKIEAELFKAQKLESVGVLAGGIAHDFNNILTAIVGGIMLAKMGLERSDEAYQVLEEVEQASARAKALTQQLLTFSRGGAPVRQAASIAGLVQESARFALSGSRARCDLELPADLWPVEVDEGQIGQVISNLVINADQAMPTGGTVRIRAGNVTIGEEPGLPLAPGRFIRVSVEDEGIGIAAEHLPKIFDPYFTTKQKGSGLGLAVVYSIVKNHDGTVVAENRHGAGTRVTFYLPASSSPLTRPAEGAGEPVHGQGRILLMDDDPMVRQVAGQMLARLGYEADLVADGAEAVQRYREARRSPRPYEVVVLDLTVPGGVGGQQALVRLKEIDPGVRAIVASGYANDPVLAGFRDHGFQGFVSKPYDLHTLGAALHEVLREARGADE